MNIERINPEKIEDIQGAKKVMREILDCMFEMKREMQRELLSLNSKNVKSLDFNITRTENEKAILKDYYTAAEIDEKLSQYQTITD